jgi:RNA-binding protein
MTLTTKYKQQLKAQAHALKPVVLIGNQGLSKAVAAEIDRALHDHELIKVRIANEDRAERQQVLKEISHKLNAEPVQVIGKIGVLYRKNQEKN